MKALAMDSAALLGSTLVKRRRPRGQERSALDQSRLDDQRLESPTAEFTLLSLERSLLARAVRAHALKNCLAIVCAVNHLVEPEVAEVTRQRLSRSQEAVRRMIAQIEEDLHADHTSSQEGEAEFVSAGHVMDAVRRRVEDQAESRQVRVHFRTGAGGVCGDAHELAEALGNVVMNAIQSSSSGGVVVVTSGQSAEGEQLWTVRDAGPGIARHLLSHVGTPSSRGARGGRGSGLPSPGRSSNATAAGPRSSLPLGQGRWCPSCCRRCCAPRCDRGGLP
jgi:signal transduction histidine kinase